MLGRECWIRSLQLIIFFSVIEYNPNLEIFLYGIVLSINCQITITEPAVDLQPVPVIIMTTIQKAFSGLSSCTSRNSQRITISLLLLACLAAPVLTLNMYCLFYSGSNSKLHP